MTTAADLEVVVAVPDPEVDTRPRRRIYGVAERLRILAEYDAAPKGRKGDVLRKEGVYASRLTDWRRRHESGGTAASLGKRGRKANDPRDSEIGQLKTENERLTRELERARRVADVQGNVCALLQELSRPSAEQTLSRPSTLL